MALLGCEVVRPLLHERPTAVELVGPRICLFDTATKLMRQGRLDDLTAQAVQAGSQNENAVADVAWPETLPFEELLRLAGQS